MIIKELPKEDFELAKQLYCECFYKEYKKTTIQLNGTILGIYINNELIGISQIDYINNVFENQIQAYINNFCIKENYRNQGYGDILLKKCLQYIKENNGNIINMTSNKDRIFAHKLYKNNNFEIVDTIVLKKDL